jgi:hypothetical protein
MLFSPAVLDVASQLFPFDSGAMAAKLFGGEWWHAMSPFETRFSIASGDLASYARKLVSVFYSTNRQYIKGDPVARLCYDADILVLLHKFLREDMSMLAAETGGVDHRQRSIEVLSSRSVTLAEHLIWIGLPNFRLRETLGRLREIRRTVPEFFPYEYSRNFNPAEIAAHLQGRAQGVIERYLT